MRNLIVGILAGLALVLSPMGTASAVDKDAPRNVTFYFNWPHENKAGGPYRIVFEPHLTSRGYHLRHLVKVWGSSTDALDLRVGDCDRFPNRHCVRVRSLHGNQTWQGDFGFANSSWLGRIRLSEAFLAGSGLRQATLCHEIGHALGMQHHHRLGCLGRVGGWKNPSRRELRRVAEHYEWLVR